jgi:hypothetical protein
VTTVLRHVRFGSSTEVTALRLDVCFAPMSGHRQAISNVRKMQKRNNLSNGLLVPNAYDEFLVPRLFEPCKTVVRRGQSSS